MARFTAQIVAEEEELPGATLVQAKLLYQTFEAQGLEKERELRKRMAKKLARSRKLLAIKRQRIREETHTACAEAAPLVLGILERKIIGELEGECIELCFEVVNRFLSKRLPKDELYLVERVSSAIHTLLQNGDLVLECHPEQEKSLRRQLEREQLSHIPIETSDEIALGTAALRTSNGQVTINWESELHQLARAYMIRYAENVPSSQSSKSQGVCWE